MRELYAEMDSRIQKEHLLCPNYSFVSYWSLYFDFK